MQRRHAYVRVRTPVAPASVRAECQLRPAARRALSFPQEGRAAGDDADGGTRLSHTHAGHDDPVARAYLRQQGDIRNTNNDSICIVARITAAASFIHSDEVTLLLSHSCIRLTIHKDPLLFYPCYEKAVLCFCVKLMCF